jgi:hypothetical protein
MALGEGGGREAIGARGEVDPLPKLADSRGMGVTGALMVAHSGGGSTDNGVGRCSWLG